MFLFSTLLFAFSGVGITYLVKYVYPVYYNNLLVSLIYQGVYYYTSLEMLYLKFYKSNSKKNIDLPSTIEYVKNGKISKSPEICDFIIYSENNHKKIVKPIFEKTPCVKSAVSFILFTIEINNTITSLNLVGDDYNYYVSGNVIDNQFLWYFLNKHYNLKLTSPLINYTLNIIDNNVNIYSIIYPECFEITYDGIRIFKNDYNKISNDLIVHTATREIIQEFITELLEFSSFTFDQYLDDEDTNIKERETEEEEAEYTDEDEEDPDEEEEAEEEEAEEEEAEEEEAEAEDSDEEREVKEDLEEREVKEDLEDGEVKEELEELAEEERKDNQHDTDNYDFLKETI